MPGYIAGAIAFILAFIPDDAVMSHGDMGYLFFLAVFLILWQLERIEKAVKGGG